MTTIHLFRHGLTDFPKDLIGGRSNWVELVDQGRLEAHHMGLYIVRKNIIPQYIAVSPAVRTRDTARIAFTAAGIRLPRITVPRLQEHTKGKAEGQPRSKVLTAEIVAQMAAEGMDFRHEEGESLNDAADRMDSWVFEVGDQRPGEVVVGVTHGIITRAFIARHMGWGFEEFNAAVNHNAAHTTVVIDRGSIADIEFNVSTQPAT